MCALVSVLREPPRPVLEGRRQQPWQVSSPGGTQDTLGALGRGGRSTVCARRMSGTCPLTGEGGRAGGDFTRGEAEKQTMFPGTITPMAFFGVYSVWLVLCVVFSTMLSWKPRED